MTNTKESLGLHTISDGPSGGVYSRANQANLVIKAPPVGTPHFTNWDAGLTSLENTTKERFESRTATRFLDYYMEENINSSKRFRCGAKDVKIIDNIAAVSYPLYTDIRKTIEGPIVTKLLTEHNGFKVNSYDYNCIDWEDVNYGKVLMPVFSLDKIFQDISDLYSGYTQRWAGNLDLSTMYIVITYNGNYTKKNVDPCVAAATYYDSALDGKMQILKYSSENILNEGEYTLHTYYTPDNEPRYMLAANIGHALDIGPDEYYTPPLSPTSAIGFGKIECSIEIVKYQPVVGCGKVDLYTKKNGKINSYQNYGKLVSLRHNLQDGDIIKISDAQNSEINGVRYVQIIDDSTFIAYKDLDFTQRINSYYEGSPVWTACGNIYNKESQSWDYLGSLIGSNNYADPPTISTLNLVLGEKFNNANTIDDILKLDFSISDTQLAVFQEFPIGRSSIYDSFFSSLEFSSSSQETVEIKRAEIASGWADSAHGILWASPVSFLWNFEFGCSIDLVKYKDKYVLAIGQKGLGEIQSFYYQHMPSSVYGQVFLYDIHLDANGKVLPLQTPLLAYTNPSQNPVRLNSIVYAYTNDPEIAEPPPSNYEGSYYNDELFQDQFLNRVDSFAPFSSYAAGISKSFYDHSLYGDYDNPYNLIEYGNGMDYWYGSMVYSLEAAGFAGFDTSGIKYYLNNNCRNAYFTNLKVPEFLPAGYELYSHPPFWSRVVFNVYPFVDNFGKSVALDYSSGNLYLFASSKTKVVIERPNYNGTGMPIMTIGEGADTCNNPNLNKTDCGYIHVFKVEDDLDDPNILISTKIQKIYEPSTSTPPSGKNYGFYYKAKKFASHMIAKNGQLAFGQTKPIDYHTNAAGIIETSKIFIYQRSGDTYYKISTINNEKHNNFSFINKRISYEDQKEYFLRDGTQLVPLLQPDDDRYESFYYQPDRFGNWFKYNGNILVANAFDIYNEDGEYHGTNNNIYPEDSSIASNEFNRPIDYLHVYEKNNNSWNFVTKIAPAFDEFDASYSYADILGPNIYHSIRTLGNRNYSNSSFNSRTWDIDLTGCYDLINDRILLKDPLSYSVFQKEPDYVNSSRIETRLTLDKYFTYDEKYEAESSAISTCQLKFDRVSAIHKYDNYLDDYKNLYCENNKSTSVPSINYRAPIYFVNIPINSEGITQFNSITLKLEEVRSVNAGMNLKLVLFKKDPRTTVYPFYNNVCSPNASDDAQKKWRSSVGYNQQTFLKGGVFDSSLYSSSSGGNIWDECQGTSCLAKLINASSILVSGARRDYTFVIDNTQVDINDFITQDDLILDSSNNRTIARSGLPTETIEFDDLSNIGYDVSVNVEASIIVGFIYQPMDYKINTDFSARADVRIIDITFDGYSSSAPSPISQVDYTYKCKFNKVVSFDYFRTYYNNPANKVTVNTDYPLNFVEGKLIYTNPVMTAGIVPTASFNDTRSGTIDGVFSKSYEVLSVDNFGTTPETSIFTNTRSLDVQYLETLPLYINSVESIPYINLFIKTLEISNSDLNLFLQNDSKTNNLNLYISNSVSASGFQNLIINGNYHASGIFTQYITGGPVRVAPLFLKVPDFSDQNISSYIKGYDIASESMPLYIGNIVQSVAPLYLKSRDAVASTGNFNQIIYGSTNGASFSANNANLFIDVFDDARASLENNIPLKITGPDSYSQSGVNTIPLYIGQIVRNGSGDFSLYNFGGFGGAPSTGSLNFVINNTGINDSGSMPLLMPSRGFNNSLVLSENTSLFIKQASSSGNLDLYLNATQPIATGFNMSLKTGFGVLSNGTTTFIRGYRS